MLINCRLKKGGGIQRKEQQQQEAISGYKLVKKYEHMYREVYKEEMEDIEGKKEVLESEVKILKEKYDQAR